MAITLPASIQDLVGNRLLRLGTSYNNARFFFDIPASRDTSRRSRYGYELTDGVVSGTYNLDKLLGAVVLSISLDDSESVAKLIFTTNPTGSKVENSIIFIRYSSDELSYLLTEDEYYILQEDSFKILLEDPGTIEDVILSDESIDSRIFSATESETNFFIIQESDF